MIDNNRVEEKNLKKAKIYMLKPKSLAPQNVAVFEYRTFMEVISSKVMQEEGGP